MMPEMIPVDSSNIKAVGYDKKAQKLYVQFARSGYYIYSDVPPDLFNALMDAPSKGRFLNQKIKGTYQVDKEGMTMNMKNAVVCPVLKTSHIFHCTECGATFFILTLSDKTTSTIQHEEYSFCVYCGKKIT